MNDEILNDVAYLIGKRQDVVQTIHILNATDAVMNLLTFEEERTYPLGSQFNNESELSEKIKKSLLGVFGWELSKIDVELRRYIKEGDPDAQAAD